MYVCECPCNTVLPTLGAGADGQAVLHAGGVLEPGVLASVTARGLRAEFAAKAAGAAALLGAAAGAPLRTCNLFSSLAAVSGSGGQGSYAAANAVLDAWAAGLQARPGGPARAPRLRGGRFVGWTMHRQLALVCILKTVGGCWALRACSLLTSPQGSHSRHTMRTRPGWLPAAARAQAAGQPSSAVQWGAWGGAGMAARVPGFLQRAARRGLGVLRPAAGLAVLEQALAAAGRPRPGSAHPALPPVLVGAPHASGNAAAGRRNAGPARLARALSV